MQTSDHQLSPAAPLLDQFHIVRRSHVRNSSISSVRKRAESKKLGNSIGRVSLPSKFVIDSDKEDRESETERREQKAQQSGDSENMQNSEDSDIADEISPTDI